jgi:hydrogenase-4 component B
VMIMSMGAVLLSSNGLHFLFAWEIFAISSYFLITLERGQKSVRAAGWLYLAASHTGTLCLFAFFTLLAARTGSWELGPLRDRPEVSALYWLALFGFALKAGLFPLHIWLPSAHASAPSHVSALMSGVAIKMGIYGMVRFGGLLPIPAKAGWVLMGLGAAGAVFGIAFALAQNDLKRLLAYCSVENIGIIVVGFGGALLASEHSEAPWGGLLLAGALLHVWNHGLFKALLFLCAGSVLHATGTREMSRLGGLWRAMPWTAGLFAVGSIAASGLPPLNGFVSEWLVYLGLFGTATSHTASALSSLMVTMLLAVAGALALAAFIKAGAVVFLGSPRTKAGVNTSEANLWMRGPMVALAGACLTIGLAPILVWPAIARIVRTWSPQWNALDAPAPLLALGNFNLVLIVSFAFGASWLWRRVHANGARRALTWDCGYATPTARMQYTSGSFGALATAWFDWILRPQHSLRRPRGPFPIRAREMKRFPETVLERLIEPAAGLLIGAAERVRRLQHGRLQFYLVYVLVGLGGLAIVVAIK